MPIRECKENEDYHRDLIHKGSKEWRTRQDDYPFTLDGERPISKCVVWTRIEKCYIIANTDPEDTSPKIPQGSGCNCDATTRCKRKDCSRTRRLDISKNVIDHYPASVIQTKRMEFENAFDRKGSSLGRTRIPQSKSSDELVETSQGNLLSTQETKMLPTQRSTLGELDVDTYNNALNTLPSFEENKNPRTGRMRISWGSINRKLRHPYALPKKNRASVTSKNARVLGHRRKPPSLSKVCFEKLRHV